MSSPRWPRRLWLIRHGQSAGNVARDAAHAAGASRIAIQGRDVDVALSDLGQRQSEALGQWFAQGKGNGIPDVILCSPYRRALDTAQAFRRAAGADADQSICIDERLREKEFGILDGLTTSGVASIFPEQAEFRRTLGKFYHRPPGGESWCDVIFRLRSLMDTVSLHYSGRDVMIVAHQVAVLCLRYVIENLTEEQVLAIDHEGDVANCSVTEYRHEADGTSGGGLVLSRYNVTAPMDDVQTKITSAPDRIVGARG